MEQYGATVRATQIQRTEEKKTPRSVLIKRLVRQVSSSPLAYLMEQDFVGKKNSKIYTHKKNRG